MERVAATDFTVLVEGESGSGKELVARQSHDLSARRQGPFIAVNCAALVETLLEAELFGIEDRIATGVRARRGTFEAADRGTLFLDEVDDLSPAAQAKLLRAVQDLAVERVGGHNLRRVNIRLVVATNQSLRQFVDAGRFREDLYYRLAGVELQVPSLRKRRDDVLELAEYFLARHHLFRQLSLSDGAAEALLSYGWPGNVRELQRVIERAVALTPGHVVTLSDWPPELTREYAEVLHPSAVRADSMRAWGSRYARLVLERCDRNKRRTCDVLASVTTRCNRICAIETPGGAEREAPSARPSWRRQSIVHAFRMSSITPTPRRTFSTEIRSLLPWTPPRSAAGTTNGV